jgi:DNA end-binding protein Ku
VVITPEELDGLEPQKTRTIDIEDFVDLSEIDPIYYDHPYYLAPDKGATKAYRLLLDAMKNSEKVAIARVVLRSKEHLVAIRPRDGVLTMETMLFADEVIPPDNLEEVPADGKAKTTKKELDMAKQLIDSLSSEFEPGKYRDEYRDRVMEMIERKAEGEEVVLEAPPAEPQPVPDLMAALEASVSSAKRQAGRPAGGRRRTGGRQSRDGAGSGSSRRKTAKKS